MKLHTKLAPIVLGALLMGCQAKTETTPTETQSPMAKLPTLEMVWKAEGFDTPECLLMSPDNKFLYVTNIDGDVSAKDGNGYISKIAPDGTLIEHKWATGMDAPKGMELDGNTLYVSDIDTLLAIDVHTGDVTKSIASDTALFLNDVAVVPGLGVLVSDSRAQSIFLYDGTKFELWLKDEQLDGINGLTLHDGHVLVTTMTKGELFSLDVTSKALTRLAGGMEKADGIKVLSDGSYITSSWPGQLWHVSKTGETSLLQDTSAEEIYMNDFELVDDMLYIANLNKGTVQAIEIKF